VFELHSAAEADVLLDGYSTRLPSFCISNWNRVDDDKIVKEHVTAPALLLPHNVGALLQFNYEFIVPTPNWEGITPVTQITVLLFVQFEVEGVYPTRRGMKPREFEPEI